MKDLLAILTLASIALGFVFLAWRGRESAARIASLGLLALAAPLLWQVDRGKGMSWTWIPHIAPFSFDLSAPGVYLAMMTVGSLALTLQESTERPPPRSRQALLWGLNYLLCGFAVAALTVDQFLVRYALLEMVVLCGLLFFILEPDEPAGKFPLWRRYLQFRLSDVALLLGILWLHRTTGTFVIEETLTGASRLASEQRLPILLGGTLAAWVKLGLPPFQGWLLDSARLGRRSQAWLAGTAWPVLGAYLLYRLAPLITETQPLRLFYLLSGSLILVLALYKSLKASEPARRVSWILAAHGALMPILSGTSTMRPYLLTFIPIRLGLCWLRPRESSRELLPTETNAGTVAVEPDPWACMLAKWASAAEHVVLEGLNRGVARLLLEIGVVLRAHHDGRLRRYILWACAGLVALVAATWIMLAH